MNTEQINYICSNQVKWRDEYKQQKQRKKEIRKVLGRQYNSKCSISKNIIKEQLMATLDIPLMCIKENQEGNLFISYLV